MRTGGQSRRGSAELGDGGTSQAMWWQEGAAGMRGQCEAKETVPPHFTEGKTEARRPWESRQGHLAGSPTRGSQ